MRVGEGKRRGTQPFIQQASHQVSTIGVMLYFFPYKERYASIGESMPTGCAKDGANRKLAVGGLVRGSTTTWGV